MKFTSDGAPGTNMYKLRVDFVRVGDWFDK